MVLPKNNECYFEVLRLSRNVNFVSLQYREIETIKAVTRNENITKF